MIKPTNDPNAISSVVMMYYKYLEDFEYKIAGLSNTLYGSRISPWIIRWLTSDVFTLITVPILPETRQLYPLLYFTEHT